MKIKKILAASLVAAAGAGLLAACGGNNSSQEVDITGDYNISVWCSESKFTVEGEQVGITDQFGQQIDAFCAANPGVNITYQIEGVSESDSATQVLTDLEAAPDLYCFAQDQFARLVQANALAKLGTAAAAVVKENNDAGAVSAATSGDSIYAYPLTSDNGYFMYYDKRVVKTEHLDSLEDIIADCSSAGKNFVMENETSAWYVASWFFGTGCHSSWTTDSAGKFIAVDDDFDSTAGLAACKGMAKLVRASNYVSSSDASQFDAAIPAGVLVSGTWAFETVKGILGDNLGTAKLPHFTVDGTKYQMGSFAGYKLLGVKPQAEAKRSAMLHKRAQYLTGEKCQEERFDLASWGPSNKTVAAMQKVTDNPGLKALIEQNQYSVVQGQIHGSWWNIGKAIAQGVKDATGEDDKALETAYKAVLKTYSDALNLLFEEPVSGMTGSPADCNWSTIREGTKNGDGKWELTTTLEAGDQVQFVKYLKSAGTIDWDGQCGYGAITSAPDGSFTGDAGNKGSNIEVLKGGSYHFVWEFDNRTIVVTAA